MISPTSIITIPSDVLFQELSGESVLLNLTSGKYYGLDDVGTRIWMLLAEQKNISSILQIMLEEYDVDRDRLEKDTFALIEDLIKNRLLALEPLKSE